MQNRLKDEIWRDILAVCNGGSSITNIMFRGYVTHQQAKLYTQQLIESGLLKYDRLEKRYFTTPDGMQSLAMMEQMAEILPIITKRTVRENLLSPFL